MFSVAGDDSDIRVLNAYPASSDCETDVGCGGQVGDGDDEIPILYGKTQALDHVDCGDNNDSRNGGVKGCGEMQLVDTCADEPSEQIEVLSEQDVPSSAAGTSCDAGSGGRGCFEESADGGDYWQPEKEELSSDSDASTDDEDSYGGNIASPASLPWGGSHKFNSGSRRSFTDIRAKAVRSSGLAASRLLASQKLGGDHSKKVDNNEDGGTDIWGLEVSNRTENKKCFTSLYNEIGEPHLEHGTEKSIWSSGNLYKQGDKDNRSNNTRVRKLFDETYLERDECAGNADDDVEPKCMCPSFATDNVGGLSYVVSQEPEDQSQDNALKVVDKFLLTNDVGSSQEFTNGMSDIFKCAPVSCTKIFEHLAEKNDHRNSVGIPSIFDWDDNLEDEGGGDFFVKRKDLLFEGTTTARNIKSHRPKIRPSNRSIAVIENDQTLKGENKIICNEATASAHSDSRSVMQNSIKNNVFHILQTKTTKNLFDCMDEESNPKVLEDNIKIAEVLKGVYNCGLDTHIAAEAVEALYHASPVNPRYLTPGISLQKNNTVVNERAPPKNVLHQKRTSPACPSDAEGIVTRSMRRRIQATKTSSVLHTDLSIDYRMKNQEYRCSEMKMKLETLKHGQLTTESSERHATSESVKRKMGESRLGKISDKIVDISAEQQNGDDFFSKELKIGDQDDDFVPVSHHTRHSKRVKLLEDAKSLNKGSEPEGNDLTVMQKEGKFIADASSPQLIATGSAIISPPLDLEVGKCSSSDREMPISGTVREDSRASFMETMVNQRKHQRTTQHTLGKQNFKDNCNEPVISTGNQARIDGHTKNGEIKKVYIRSVSEILLKAKQKRRIVSTQILLEYNALLSKSKLAPGLALRSKSLQNSPLESNKCLFQSVSNQVGPVKPTTFHSDGLNEHVVDAEKLSTHNSGEDAEDAQENAQVKDLSRGEIKSPSLACATPSKRKNVLSPVCVAEDLPRSSNRVSATPAARELLRFEPSEASAAPRNKHVHRRKDVASIRVLFSNHLAEDTVKQQKKILTHLGVAVASSILDATHFVADKFMRTRNMLEAIAVGKPVVTPMWLESCGQARCFLDEMNYILRDTKMEKEIGFNMQVSLDRACQSPILLGKTVYMTPNVKPSIQVLSSVVKAANGQVIARIGRSLMKQAGLPSDLLIISCLEDYSLCIPLLEKGARVFSSELLLNGIVIQKLECGRHELFLDRIKRTRSTIWLKDKVGQFLPVNRCT